MSKPQITPVPQRIAERYVRKLANVIEQIESGDSDVTWELGCIAQDLQDRITRENDRVIAEEEGPTCGTPFLKMQAIKELRKESAFINKLLKSLGINKNLADGAISFSEAKEFNNEYMELLAKASIQPDWLAEGSPEYEAFEAKQNTEFAEGMEWLRRDVLEHLAKNKKADAIVKGWLG